LIGKVIARYDIANKAEPMTGPSIIRNLGGKGGYSVLNALQDVAQHLRKLLGAAAIVT
jgi:hypothetical protein